MKKLLLTMALLCGCQINTRRVSVTSDGNGYHLYAPLHTAVEDAVVLCASPKVAEVRLINGAEVDDKWTTFLVTCVEAK